MENNNKRFWAEDIDNGVIMNVGMVIGIIAGWIIGWLLGNEWIGIIIGGFAGILITANPAALVSLFKKDTASDVLQAQEEELHENDVIEFDEEVESNQDLQTEEELDYLDGNDELIINEETLVDDESHLSSEPVVLNDEEALEVDAEFVEEDLTTDHSKAEVEKDLEEL